MTKGRRALVLDPRGAKAAAFHRYYWSHHESILARGKVYYAAHREQELARTLAWKRAHTEHLTEYYRGYYQENKERERDGRRRRDAARRPPAGRDLRYHVADTLEDPEQYIWETMGIELRPYQAEPLKRVLESIENHLGDTIILMFPRQSGKDELLLDLMVYLADLYSLLPVGIVAVNPTYRPQTVTALERFDAVLSANNLTHEAWRSQGGFMRILGQARISFLSGEPSANVSGATASLLLVVNEAQDISPQVYHQKFEPMAASMNATRILAGTAWTSRTLLAQEMRAALQAEQDDGRKRVFTVDADAVRRVAPWYGAHVDAIVRAHGRQHPLVKTQYFNEEIDAETGMFNAARRALMGSDQRGQTSKLEGHTYVFCIDVAGQDEARAGVRDIHESALHGLPALSNASRDSTTLSIVDIDLSTLATLQAPTYRVVQRMQWTGLNHLMVFGKLKALADQWRPQHIVIDATGVGEGLWAMLEKAFPAKVIPVKFSAEKKSEIGYRFISLIETGRFHDCCTGDSGLADRQYAACQAEVLTGPRKTMRWGVPEGTRDENGELIHDDIVLADALITEVDALEWTIHSESLIVRAADPLEEMSRFRKT